MRHGSRMASPVPLLAEGMPAGPESRRLVAPAGGSDLLAAMDRPASSRAIALAAVTTGANPDLLPTVPALEDPVAFFDRRAWPWTSAAREPILAGSSLAEQRDGDPVAKPVGSPFLLLRACFYTKSPLRGESRRRAKTEMDALRATC